ncbi:MAG: twin-arginine translocase TatA/TatE family subunit [Phycisphaerae bacterium]
MTMQPIAFLGPIGWPEIIVILVVLLLLFGGKKLPELARGLGRGLRTFKEEVSETKKTFTDELDREPDKEDDTQQKSIESENGKSTDESKA